MTSLYDRAVIAITVFLFSFWIAVEACREAFPV
jgi:hypothetical protein